MALLKRMNEPINKWKLYWATTPCHLEDWFIVSSSQLKAAEFHDGEGFNEGYSSAEYICDVPLDLKEESHLRKEDDIWPSQDLLIKLGMEIIDEDYPRVVRFNKRVFKEGRGIRVTLEEESSKKPGLDVVHMHGTKNCKIGFSTNMKQRLGQLRGASPQKIELRYFIETQHYRSFERHIHQEFGEHKVLGEWFQFEEDQLKRLEGIFQYVSHMSNEFRFIDIDRIYRWSEQRGPIEDREVDLPNI